MKCSLCLSKFHDARSYYCTTYAAKAFDKQNAESATYDVDGQIFLQTLVRYENFSIILSQDGEVIGRMHKQLVNYIQSRDSCVVLLAKLRHWF